MSGVKKFSLGLHEMDYHDGIQIMTINEQEGRIYFAREVLKVIYIGCFFLKKNQCIFELMFLKKGKIHFHKYFDFRGEKETHRKEHTKIEEQQSI